MATDLATFKAELETAKALEDDLLHGYTELLVLPLSAEAKAEAAQAQAWVRNRAILLGKVDLAIQELIASGYPSREAQLAPESIVNEFKTNLDLMIRAFNQFEIPPDGVITVGPQVPV